jgi:flagellin-specific chaperone FliS
LVEELRDDDSLRQYVLNYVSDQLPNIMIPNDDWENYNSRVKVPSEQQRCIQNLYDQNFEQLHKSAKAKAFSEYVKHVEALNTIDKIAEILSIDLKVSYQTKYGRKTFVEKYSRIERYLNV